MTEIAKLDGIFSESIVDFLDDAENASAIVENMFSDSICCRYDDVSVVLQEAHYRKPNFVSKQPRREIDFLFLIAPHGHDIEGIVDDLYCFTEKAETFFDAEVSIDIYVKR